MTNLTLVAVFVLVGSTAACGDDTGSTGLGGAGGEDPLATVVGAGGGNAGCTPNDTLPCTCREGDAGTKTCVQNQVGDTFFDQCKNNDGPC